MIWSAILCKAGFPEAALLDPMQWMRFSVVGDKYRLGVKAKPISVGVTLVVQRYALNFATNRNTLMNNYET